MADPLELAECDRCGAVGLPERIEAMDCPHHDDTTGDAEARARAAAQRLDALPSVAAVDILAPDTDPTHSWTVELIIEGAAVPPHVLRILAETSLSLRPAASRDGPGPHSVVVTTA